MRYVAAGMAGALLTMFLLGAGPATQDVVRCRRLEVVEANGAVRSAIFVDEKTDAVRLMLMGEDGVFVSSSAGAAAFVMTHHPKWYTVMSSDVYETSVRSETITQPPQ